MRCFFISSSFILMAMARLINSSGSSGSSESISGRERYERMVVLSDEDSIALRQQERMASPMRKMNGVPVIMHMRQYE